MAMCCVDKSREPWRREHCQVRATAKDAPPPWKCRCGVSQREWPVVDTVIDQPYAAVTRDQVGAIELTGNAQGLSPRWRASPLQSAMATRAISGCSSDARRALPSGARTEIRRASGIHDKPTNDEYNGTALTAPRRAFEALERGHLFARPLVSASAGDLATPQSQLMRPIPREQY